MRANGSTISDVKKAFPQQGFHRWKTEVEMQQVDQAKQLWELQKGAHLKRMLADAIIGNEVLKEALDDNSKPCTKARAGA